MRAIVVDTLGALPYLADVPVPKPAPGQLLIKVAAAGLNPYDWQLADGVLRGSMPNVLPFVLGNDAVGTVVELGAGVTGHRVGDRLFGQTFHAPLGEGTFAEYALVPAGAAITLLPARFPDEIGAALPTAALTALGLIDAIEGGAAVLIVGASGGVGSFATQIAADRGHVVLATASGSDAARVMGLGAAQTFDHRQGDLVGLVGRAHPTPIDAIVDLVSDPAALVALTKLVRKGGLVLSTIGSVDVPALASMDIRGVNFEMQPSPDGLERLLALIAADRLSVPIEAVVGLEDAPAAIAKGRAGGARGKTVIRIG